MSRVEAIESARGREWNDAAREAGITDPYYRAEYHQAHEANGDGSARVFVFAEGDDVMFHPFMLKPIGVSVPLPPGEWRDLESVYGYTGPVATTANKEFLGRAWAAFGEWCEAQHVAAEFLRLNPLVASERYLDAAYALREDRHTVVVNLPATPEQLWAAYPSVQRNMVRKAEGRGLRWEERTAATSMPIMQEIYANTMARVGADESYFFSPEYFAALSRFDAVKLFTVVDGDSVAACGLFLSGPDVLHYHLSGSDARYRDSAATNLLLHGAALWAQERGAKQFHLGGGRTAAADDSLLKFKASVSRDRCAFRLATIVRNSDVYDTLCAGWMRERDISERPPYFLLYRLRQPGPACTPNR